MGMFDFNDDSQQQQDPSQNPLNQFVSGAAKSAGSSMGNTISGLLGQRLMNIIGGPTYKKEKEFEVESNISEKEHEKDEQQKSLLDMYNEKWNSGQPLDEKAYSEGISMGIAPQLLDAGNSHAADVVKSRAVIDNLAKAGVLDPKQHAILSAMSKNPQLAPAINELLKSNQKIIEQIQKAVLQRGNIRYQQGLIGQRQENMEGERHKDRLSEIGAAGGERLNVGKQLQTHEEMLQEKLAGVKQKLKGLGGGQGSVLQKALGNVGETVRMLSTGQTKQGKKIEDFDPSSVGSDMLDVANSNLLSTPNIKADRVIQSAGIGVQSSDGKYIVGEGIDGFVRDAVSKGAMNDRQGQNFLRTVHGSAMSQKSEELQLRALSMAIEGLPDNIKSQVRQQFQQLFDTLDGQRQASAQDSTDDSAPMQDTSGGTEGMDTGTDVMAKDEDDD